MDRVELPKRSPAESYHAGIQRQGAIMTERREIDDFDAALYGSPAPFAVLGFHTGGHPIANPEIRRQNGHLMASLHEPSGKCSNLDDRPALFLERIVCWYYL
jgi:hypothetical protein